jgi:RNA recognition motif-containing protein
MQNLPRKDSFGPEVESEPVLFIGCLDPLTTKDDIMDYFRPYDHFIKAKLIYKLNTNQSKQ